MSDAKWTGYLSYLARHSDINAELKGDRVPVINFSLPGGAGDSSDVKIFNRTGAANNFRQSRGYQNITLYIPPTKNFEWHHLYEISCHALPVAINFTASAEVGKTISKIYLTCKNARITRPPARIGIDNRGRTALMIKMALPEKHLVYNFYRQQRRDVQTAARYAFFT